MFKLWCFAILVVFGGNFHSTNAQWENTINVVLETFYGLYAPISSAVKNPECSAESKIYHKGLMEFQGWAHKMLDASSKVPTGVLSGNNADLGQFDQCYATYHVGKNGEPDIRAKYCATTFVMSLLNTQLEPEEQKRIEQEQRIEGSARAFLEPFEVNQTETRESSGMQTLPMTWAICVPSACTAQDVEDHLNSIIPSIFKNMFIKAEVKVKEINCQDKGNAPKLLGWDWVVLCVFILIGGLMFFQTLYEGYLMYTDSEPNHEIFVSFSVINNGKKLIRVSKSKEQFHCLHGIRWLSMMWVIYGHKLMYDAENKAVYNKLALQDFLENWFNYIPLGAMVAVDTFLMMSGMLAMYLFLKTKSSGKSVNVLLMYVHRYLRLTPPILFMLLCALSISKHLGSGPFWPATLQKEYKTCEKSWWAILLYVQNYRSASELCLPHTWYLSTDTQLFVLSPIFMFTAWKYPKYAIHFHSVALIASILAAFGIVFGYDFSVSYMSMLVDMKFFEKYYFPLHTRISAYIVGLMLGYIMFQKKKTRVVISPITNVICWFVCLSVMVIILLCQYPMNQEWYTRVAFVESFYEAVHRPLWCICMAWIIYACSFGYGGPINWFLSLPIFQVLARLSYCMYITHFSVLSYRIIASAKTPAYFSKTNLYWTYWGDLAVVTLVGLFWTLAFELPFGSLEDLIFKRQKPTVRKIEDRTSKIEIEKENNNSSYVTRI